MNKIIEQLLSAGVRMQLYKKDEDFIYEIYTGFKSNLYLYETYGNLHCRTRYDTVDTIGCLDDLIAIHYFWFLEAKERWGTSPLEHVWEKLYIETGRLEVKEEVITNKVYDFK